MTRSFISKGQKDYSRLKYKVDQIVNSRKVPFSVISRLGGEASLFSSLQRFRTPPGFDTGSTGVTTYYDLIKVKQPLEHCEDEILKGV